MRASRAQPPCGVGALAAVDCVIKKVGGDLNAKRRRQGETEQQLVEHAPLGMRKSKPQTHRHHRSQQRLRPRRQQQRPDKCWLLATVGDLLRRVAHGTRGNFEKSGSRFSTNASLPSLASSDM